MHFHFVTLFPGLVSGYFSDSILGRAAAEEKISFSFTNPRDFSFSKHKKVDDYQVGGGAGLLMSPQPLWEALSSIKASFPDAYMVFPAPVGKPFKQNDAKRLAKHTHIVFVCGRYEGIDERIIEAFADALFSIGDYVLTGGELASMVMCDAISRNVSGVLGNDASLEEESFEQGLLEAPSFTKPNEFKKSCVPSEFLKGNHGKIAGLKKEMACAKTQFYRPDLYANQKPTCQKKDH
jgi:tRNA (guanine37-N1)-methyltransferase